MWAVGQASGLRASHPVTGSAAATHGKADVCGCPPTPRPPRRKHTAGGVGDLFVSPTPPRKQNHMALIWVFLHVVIFHLANKMAVTFWGSVTL